MTQNPLDAEIHELSHQRDLAAYAVLGAARVLFRQLPDGFGKYGLDLIAEYDLANQALDAAHKRKERAA